MRLRTAWVGVWRCGVLLPGLVLLDLVLSGCSGPTNPSFNVSSREAYAELRRMKQTPRPLVRPVVVLGGWIDPGLAAGHLESEFKALFADDRIVTVSFAFNETFDDCRAKLIERVNERFASDGPAWTVEVDVVAVSMGGLVARYAAMPHPQNTDAPRLRIARLFTIATPHQGAKMAVQPTFNQLQISMRAGGGFIEQLGDALGEAGYELHPYARLGDAVVGVENTAPAGMHPRWVPNRAFEPAHAMAFRDPRIKADIARRLRDEPPLSTDPPAPLPEP